jgi:glutaminyl-peptide cyclotransferase
MTRLAGGLSLVALVVLVGCLLMWRPWNGKAEPPVATLQKAQNSEFAADRAPLPVEPVPFDPQRAMDHLSALCRIGPRISGSEGMTKQQELLKKHFEQMGGQVTLQSFTARQSSVRKPTAMANLIASWSPARTDRVILCSHYDTRPIADQEPNPRQWREPFVSANDGGSGVALLMELARHLRGLKTGVGVDIVLFDGEEYVFEPGIDKYFFGSEHFAREYRKQRGRVRYVAAVLLDMVGGKDAHFPVEQNSWWMAAPLVQEIWKTAEEQHCAAFRSDQLSKTAVQDDHIALNQAGIPAVDIIDFDYRHWHRLSDTPENCSGESLEQVARVLGVWLQRLR